MTRPDSADAARMLAELDTARSELARRAVAPVWYHPALGLQIGGLVAVQGQPFVILYPYYVLFGLGLWGLVTAYKRRTGMWINGYRPGRTRWVAMGLAVLVAAVMLGSVILMRTFGWTAAPLIGGAIAAVITTAAGFLWEAAFRRDLKDGLPL